MPKPASRQASEIWLGKMLLTVPVLPDLMQQTMKPTHRVGRIRRHLVLAPSNADADLPANDDSTLPVVVDGTRTPFTKSFGELIDQDSIALGVTAVQGLLDKTVSALTPCLYAQLMLSSLHGRGWTRRRWTR